MLVLSRKRDEKILMQVPGMQDIEVTVVRIDQKKVRLGIKANDEVTILRSELTERDGEMDNSIELSTKKVVEIT